jgi:simple sugar transport system substrate-binding protein
MERFGWLALVSVLFAACGPPEDPPPERNYRLISHGDPSNPFWRTVERGMNDAAEDMGVGAVFSGATDPSMTPAAQQAAFIRQAVAEGVDGIGVTITDPAVLDAPLAEAEAAGIPIVAFNVPLSPADAVTYDLPLSTYIGQIETTVGSDAGTRGRAVIEAAGRTLDVALCIKGMNDASWAVQRCDGFNDGLTAMGVTVTTLGGDFYAEPPNIPMATIADYFANNPSVDLVFSTAPAVLNLLNSLRQAGTIGPNVVIGSVDLDELTLTAIRSGVCAFAIDQQPYMQGYLSVTTLELERTLLIRPSSDIQTGPFYVDANNVEEIAELIAAGYR